MILNAVILFLREALEAALLISVLMALGMRLGYRNYWVLVAVIIGMIGSVLFANQIASISNLFDGVGQEIAHATLHGTIAMLLLIIVGLWLYRPEKRLLIPLMIVVVAIAIVREGSEIWIYYAAFINAPDRLPGVTLGGGIGLCIGLSVGAILYYCLAMLPEKYYRGCALTLFALVAAGMLSQAINALIQADLITTRGEIWDTSGWINEGSVTGQLLYALIGYQAQPSLYEALGYLLILLLFAGLALSVRWTTSFRSLR